MRLSVLALLLCGCASATQSPSSQWQPRVTPHQPGVAASLLYAPHAGTVLFGVAPVHRVVASDYSYEASLLDYSTPVADLDYMLNYGEQAYVKLPGLRSDVYGYAGTVYVIGSGWVQKWRTPNGGRFALLHLNGLYTASGVAPVQGPTQPPPILPTTTPPSGWPGDDNTALAAGGVQTLPQGVALARYRGGTIVAASGWPAWTFYGNGSAGPSDAHLCVVLDARASAWFAAIASGRHHPRKRHPFVRRLWDQWCHRKPHRHCTNPYDRHHHLIWSADQFRFHTWLGGKKRGDRWYEPRGGYGYDQYPFGHGVLRCWPHYHACSASRH